MRVAVFGASGYTGLELLRILLRHPRFELAVVTSEQRAGEPVGDAFPSLRGLLDLRFTASADAARLAREVDLAFTALPHAASAPDRRGAAQGRRSGARSLRRLPAARCRRLSGVVRRAPGAGAPGRARSTAFPSSTARRCARPSWWPCRAAIRPRRLLPLAPFLREGLVETHGHRDRLEVGRLGRRPQARGAAISSPSWTRTAIAYKPGHEHRHAPEIEQEASLVAGTPVRVTFVPHLLPAIRGIVTTRLRCGRGARLPAAEARAVLDARLREASASCACCRPGATPSLAAVRGSNFCDVAAFATSATAR